MRYGESEFARLEKSGALNYAERKPPVYPRWVFCKTCGTDHPEGFHLQEGE